VVSAVIMTMQQPKPQAVTKNTPQTQQAPAKGGQNAPQGGK
jgi:hypothetical protein